MTFHARRGDQTVSPPFRRRRIDYLVSIALPVAIWFRVFVLEVLDRTVRVGLGFVLGFTLGLIVIVVSIDILIPVILSVAKLLAFLISLILGSML